jgi:hypothetical protein
MATSADVEQLLAKMALHELNTGYCRAVDRVDEAAFVALFHPDAIVDSGVLRGSPAEFAPRFANWIRTRGRVTSHAVSNEWYVVDGDRAVGETYVVAVARLISDPGEKDTLTVGRYFDRFERRDGVWKFSERRFVMDHTLTLADGLPPLPADNPADETHGHLAPHDPICRFWPKA